ncbi:MAG: CRISPR system precrRNA processing endoribonuclease RAMP protein Cas6 [Acidobacteriota bacterium]|nr:CRISPR system precrRNA processing endoribonuclease RAMP protein Cas6 [Acidobacteriota bacterium]
MSTGEIYAQAAARVRRRRMRFTLQLERPLRLRFPAALLRGGLGNLLRRRYCRSPSQRCHGRHRCAYCELFEARGEAAGGGWAGRQKSAPVPLAIRCEPGEWAAGRMVVELFGQAVDHGRVIKDAFEEMGERGLGRERVRCAFRADEGWQTVEGCDEGIRRILGGLSRAGGLRVRSESPLRVKAGGRWAQAVGPRLMIVNAARRFSALACESPEVGSLPAPCRELLERAASIPLRQVRWVWTDRHRYSSRQRRRVPMGGVEGGFELDIPDVDLLFFFALAESVGIGKGIPFGFGRVKLETA